MLSLLHKISLGMGGSGESDVYIIIQSGQSNALGSTSNGTPPVPALLPEEYKGEQEDIQIWWEGDYLNVNPLTGAFENMNPVSNTRHHDYTDPAHVLHTSVGWSTEQEMSHRLLNDYPEIYIIKNAYSAQRIDSWLAPLAARWVELERYITRGLEYFDSINAIPTFLGFTWMQGETDISQGTTQGDYQTALEDLIDNVRGLSPYLADLKFYLCKIPTDHYGDESVVNTSFINIAAADVNVEYIDTSAYAVGYTGLPRFGHYTAQNLLDLGGDLYNKIAGINPVYPNVLDDGNTDGWYDYKRELTLISGVDGVSVWGDISGNGNDLLQADPNKQPELTEDGILFDGVDDFMKAVYALVQPTQVYIVFKQITWLANMGIFSGTGANLFFYQNGVTPDLKVFAGSLGGANDNAPLDTYVIARVLMNGASSKTIINETTPVTGNFGAADMDGITVGSRNNGGNPGHSEIKEIIVRKIADASGDEQDIYDYLSAKYGIV